MGRRELITKLGAALLTCQAVGDHAIPIRVEPIVLTEPLSGGEPGNVTLALRIERLRMEVGCDGSDPRASAIRDVAADLEREIGCPVEVRFVSA